MLIDLKKEWIYFHKFSLHSENTDQNTIRDDQNKSEIYLFIRDTQAQLHTYTYTGIHIVSDFESIRIYLYAQRRNSRAYRV